MNGKSTMKTAVLAVFALGCAAGFLIMFVGTGLRLPFTEPRDYVVSFETDDAGNLAPASDVQVAGVSVGKVKTLTNGGPRGARIELELTPDAAPLHRGATVRVGERSLVGEGFVQIADGQGEELESGTQLPREAVKDSTQLHDVLRSLDPQTRDALSGLGRSLGDSTADSQQDLSKLMAGMGDLGREGHTAVDAISAQSADLTALASQTTDVLRALNSSEGQLDELVVGAERITSSTSAQSENIRSSVRQLPGVLDRAGTASVELQKLSAALTPVAGDLKVAAPHLTTALNELPATSKDLRGLLPPLNTALDQAPNTLDRVPAFADDVSAMVPTLRTTMSNLNPIVGYLQPYGRDLAGFFTNFGAIMDHTDEAGIAYLRLKPSVGNEQAPTGVPARLPTILSWKNPYPHPGQAENPGPNGRGFDRIYPQPR